MTDQPTTQPVYPDALLLHPTPPEGTRLTENLRIPVRDGITLAADLYQPLAEGKYPVLLSLSPYAKEIQQKPPHWSHAIESGATGFYVAHGYIHIIVQVRGAGLSQGRWALFDEKERTDGYDIIEWIAAQPWCDGNIGMIGDSYWSWSQYHAAAAQPPHLRCICQCDGTTDLYRDMIYQGGVYNAEFLDTWISYQTKMAAWPGPVDGKEPPMNLTYEAAMRPTNSDWYQSRSAWPVLHKIKVPVLSISPQGGAMHARGQLAGYAKITAPKKLLVVPPTGFWSHLRYLTNPALNAQMLRWFDHWLKGKDTGLMQEPEVAIYDTGTNDWRHEAEYPIARTQWTKLHLGPNATLTPTPPETPAADSYKLPDSLAQTLSGKPVLAYTTAPLDQPMRLWGPLSLTLYAASSQPDTVFHIKLADIAPDGTPRPLSRGILRASFRALDDSESRPGQPFHPFTEQILLTPGKIEEFQIELRPLFHTIKPGHRLAVTIASEDIAYSNRQRTIDVQLLPWPVENTVHFSQAHPSHLLLPVIPDAPEIKKIEPPIANIHWPLIAASWMPNTEGWPLKP